jgi:hypothetical protein
MGKKKKSNMSQSGEKETSSSSQKPHQPSPNENQSVKYYQSIQECPLSRYKDAKIRKNLSALIISGFPTEEQLAEAWLTIQQEYADAIGDQEYKMYLEAFKDVQLANCSFEQVNICTTALDTCFKLDHSHPGLEPMKQKWADNLNDVLQTTFEFNLSNKESYYKNLQRCINRSKGIKLDLDLKLARLESLKEKHEKGKEADEAYFTGIIITLSDAAGYPLKDDITVFEFCERIKRLNNARNRRTDRPLR